MFIDTHVQGQYQVKQYRDGVLIFDSPWYDNQILNNAYNYIGNGLNLSNGNVLELGTGNTANTQNTTDVQTPITFTLKSTSTGYLNANTQNAQGITYTGGTTFDVTMGASGQISELAIQGFSRVVLATPISVNNGDDLRIAYQVTTVLTPAQNVAFSGTDANGNAISGSATMTPVLLSGGSYKSVQWTDLFATWTFYPESTVISPQTVYTPTNGSLKNSTAWANTNQSSGQVSIVGRIINNTSNDLWCNTLYVGNGYCGFLIDLSAGGGIQVRAGKYTIPTVYFNLNF